MSCCTEWPREKDLELHDMRARKLLEPGWGGELTHIEYNYIRQHLEKDSRLRSRWGFHRGRGWKLSEELIRKRAAMGIDETPEYPTSDKERRSVDRAVGKTGTDRGKSLAVPDRPGAHS